MTKPPKPVFRSFDVRIAPFIAGGMHNALLEAERLGFSTTQVFTKNQALRTLRCSTDRSDRSAMVGCRYRKRDFMTLHGTLDNGKVVLDQPAPWPDGTRVEVVLQTGKKLTLAEKLLRHAGTVPDLPADMAEQHDHYIHGTPKR